MPLLKVYTVYNISIHRLLLLSRGKYKVLGEVLFYKIKNNYDIIDIQYKKELEILYYKNMEEYYAQSMVWRQG